MGDRTRRVAIVVAVLFVAFTARPAIGYDWLQFNGDAAHGGNNAAETTLAPAMSRR